jgi:uncharacterized protein YndB with AHSA1/START domain
MPDIKHSITIDAAPERVFPLIASGSGFARWWAAGVTESGADGTVELGFFNRATVYRLKPVRLASPREMEWLCQSGKEWADTRLLFALTPNNAATVVRFTHANWQSETDYFISCTTTWGELMLRLKAAAEGRPVTPLFSATSMAY